MLSRWYSVTVVVFWLSTMSWLVVRKVLPPMLVGEPPSYDRILADSPHAPDVVSWDILLDGQPLGRAVNRRELLDDEITRYDSRVLLERLPFGKLPIARLSGLASGKDGDLIDLDLETHSIVEVDPLGRLVSFEIELRLGPLQRAVVLLGTVDVDQLSLTVHAGDFSYETSSYIGDKTMIADSLSPQPQLPGLRLGQHWTVPVYNPLSPQNRPVEILQATVERQELLFWNHSAVNTLVVAYRRDSDSGLGADAEPQARAWVRRDGAVLKQQIQLFGSWLEFVRRARPPADARDAPGRALQRSGDHR